MNLGAVTTLVFDLDGVVWRGESPIPSAISAINDLRAAGKRCLFCTNNSSQTQADFVTKLAAMGIEGVAEDEVVTSSSATALYLSAQYTGPFLAYVVGGEGIRLALQKIGARIVRDVDITEDTNVDCVVAGIDREFSYEKLRVAQRLIHRGALFIATNRDATYPVEDGVIPGAGAIISAIETATGSTPVTIGKPRPVMIQLVMQKYALQPEQVAVIGDRLDTDIVCARRAGVAALLVTTGVTTLQQARRAKGELRPDAVFPDLTSFAEMALENSPSSPLETGEMLTASTPIAAAASVAAPAEIPAETESATEAESEVETPVASAFSIADASTPAEAGTTFEFSDEIAPEPKQEITDETTEISVFSTEPLVEEFSEIAPEIPTETAAPAAEKLEGWDDSWFEENAAIKEPATEEPVVEEPAATEEVAVEPETAAASTPAADSSTKKDDGFNWKLE